MADIAVENGKAVFLNSKGQKVFVAPEEGETVQQAAQRAYDANKDLQVLSPEEHFRGIFTPAATAVSEFGNQILGGVPGLVGGANVSNFLAGGREVSPTAAAVGQGAGLAASALLPGAAGGAIGAAGKAVRGALPRIGRIGQGLFQGAVEGGLAGAAQEAAKIGGERGSVGIGDAASRIASSAGKAAAIAAGFGVVAGGVSAGASRLKKAANARLDKALDESTLIMSKDAGAAAPGLTKGIRATGDAKQVVAGDGFAPVLDKGRKLKGVSSLVDAEGKVIGQWVKTGAAAKPQSIADKAATLFSLRLANALTPLGPAGKVISGLVGKVALQRIAAPALKMAARLSPGINAATALGRVGPTLPAIYSAFNDFEQDQNQQLKSDYLVAASESLESGALTPDSSPDEIFNIDVPRVGRPRTTKPSARSVIDAAKMQTPQQHADAARESYAAVGMSPPAADAFAELHRKRIALLQSLDTKDPTEEQRAIKIIDAITDPFEVVKRIKEGTATPEDFQVTNTLYPQTAEALSTASRVVLESDISELSTEKLMALQKMAGGKHRRQLDELTQSIQKSFAQQQQQGPDSRVAGLKAVPETTSLQRNQLGST